MSGAFEKLRYYTWWAIQCKLRGQHLPLTSSIIISDKCNLRCKHCTVTNLGYRDARFGDLTRAIDTLYHSGSRMLIITGGEPFLWRDGPYELDQVINYARARGFFRTVICTNGTFPLRSRADYLWVSVDGVPEVHDEIRGGVSDRVWNNIEASDHPRLYVNFTISRLNAQDFETAARQILERRTIRGIMFHLFTPVLGAEDLALPPAMRANVIHRLERFKRRHPWRVTNTFDGLKALRRDTWKRPVWSATVIDRDRETLCCCREGIYDAETCRNCGCTPAIETWVLQELKPLALLENLRFL